MKSPRARGQVGDAGVQGGGAGREAGALREHQGRLCGARDGQTEGRHQEKAMTYRAPLDSAPVYPGGTREGTSLRYDDPP